MDRDKYIEELEKLNAEPPGEDLPKQKFPRRSRVKVTDTMPDHMKHFTCGFEGIVEYTYGQKFCDDCHDEYSLIVLENGKPINTEAWYEEDQLTLVDGDTTKGLKIIEDYDSDD